MLRVIVLILVSLMVLFNIAFAQIIQTKLPSTPNSVFPSTISPATQGGHKVKILFPLKGERFPVGKDLLVSGTSAGNRNSTGVNCQVSVIVNGIKPYQPARAVGSDGDYSNWTFNLTSKYIAIKEGQNKITAKYFCANNPASLSHYSVNITGVKSNLNSTNRYLFSRSVS
jgi:hypothetical protein